MNIQQLLDDNNVRYKRTGEDKDVRSGWIGVECPNCGEGSGKFHLGINLDGVYANCWKCGTKDMASLLAVLIGKGYLEAKQFLEGLPSHQTRIKHAGHLQLPQDRGPLYPVQLSYLARRGLDGPLLARLWGVEGIGLHGGRLQWRIFIPIHQNGEIVSWTTRTIGSDSVRYISAKPEESLLPIKSLLFGADYARHAIIVCEGPFDVFSIGPGAVATLGVTYTSEQLYAMGKFPVRTVCFDNDPPAQQRAAKLCNSLTRFPGRTVNIVLVTGDDPAEADVDEIAQIRAVYLGD